MKGRILTFEDSENKENDSSMLGFRGWSLGGRESGKGPPGPPTVVLLGLFLVIIRAVQKACSLPGHSPCEWRGRAPGEMGVGGSGAG